MGVVQRFDLTRLDDLDVQSQTARAVAWQGRPALYMEDGLVLLTGVTLGDGSVELDLGTPGGGAYPGIAFRVQDARNYELAYPQPHTSGGWDALQYDPVFRGSNTWQIYNGPRYQAQADIPSGEWFTLRIDIVGQRAAVRLRPPGGAFASESQLTVANLMHRQAEGRLGIWAYLPAYFAEMRVGPPDRGVVCGVVTGAREPAPETITEWILEGYGPIQAEENGAINLNRYLDQVAGTEAVLTHEFDAEGPLRLQFGFSDDLRIEVDGQMVFAGINRFSGFRDRSTRGYVSPEANSLELDLNPGRHRLAARLQAQEPFGWGLACALFKR